MCQMCSTIPSNPQAAANLIVEVKTTIRQAENIVDKAFRSVAADEEFYRTVAISYHVTETTARGLPVPADTAKRLKEAFEICGVEEYNTFFAPWHSLLELLNEAKDEIRYSGTAHDLIHRSKHLVDLIEKYSERSITLSEKLSVLQHDMKIVAQHNIWYMESTGSSPWCELESDEFPMQNLPARRGEEWQSFRAWVWSLPETQRAVQAGRSVDEIAVELLYKEEEEVMRE